MIQCLLVTKVSLRRFSTFLYRQSWESHSRLVTTTAQSMVAVSEESGARGEDATMIALGLSVSNHDEELWVRRIGH